MSGDTESVETQRVEVMPPSHKRILIIMAVLGVLAAIVGAAAHSIPFAVGILVGVAIAYANYFWLKHSLQRVFNEAGDGEKPKISALRYIGRYLATAAVIAVIFASGILPIVPVIIGMGGFGFAVVVDGIIRIFSGVPDAKADQ